MSDLKGQRLWTTLCLADVAGILQAVCYFAAIEGNAGAAVLASIVSAWLFAGALLIAIKL